MHLTDYAQLIRNLPVRSHAFTTSRNTWIAAEQQFDWLMEMNNNLFQNAQSLQLSRQDLFDTQDTIPFILKTIYWGYPRGMRGNHFRNILLNFNNLNNALNAIQHLDNPIDNDFINLVQDFDQIPGIGLSTYSKLLHFRNIQFNNFPCLIMDQRLIDIFHKNLFIECEQLNPINIANAANFYLPYLKIMNDLAQDMNTNSENIEHFLFIFGKNLKE